jgi:hypothetical protein
MPPPITTALGLKPSSGRLPRGEGPAEHLIEIVLTCVAWQRRWTRIQKHHMRASIKSIAVRMAGHPTAPMQGSRQRIYPAGCLVNMRRPRKAVHSATVVLVSQFKPETLRAALPIARTLENTRPTWVAANACLCLHLTNFPVLLHVCQASLDLRRPKCPAAGT